MGVAAVDDDVSLVKERNQALDEIIHRLAGLDHQEYLAGCLEGLDEVFEGMGAVEVPALPAACHETVDFFNRPVEYAHMEALAFHVQSKVLAHYGETHESDV